jgi:RpiR family transcriptional regulator, carbohydrate utilization regulator
MIISAIETQLEALRPSEQLVARYILGRPSVVVHMSIADLAESVFVSEPTIMRFCKAIGCTGFMEFKLALARDLERRTFQRNRTNPAVKGPTGFGPAVFARTVSQLVQAGNALALEQIDEILELCASSRVVSIVHGGGESEAAKILVDCLLHCRIEANAKTEVQPLWRLDGCVIIGLRSAQLLDGFAAFCGEVMKQDGKVVLIGFEADHHNISLFGSLETTACFDKEATSGFQCELLYLTILEAFRASIVARLSRSGLFSDNDTDLLQSQREIAYGDARRRDRQTARANDVLFQDPNFLPQECAQLRELA